MEKQIFKIMVKEQEIIENFLDNFQKISKKDLKAAEKIFQVFIWNIEKHMFFEEKVFYSIYSVWNGDKEEIFKILKNHEDIYSLIKDIDESDFDESYISSLKEFLKEHFAFEKIILYPKLEKVLNKEQKELFLERAEEIILE